MCVEAGKNELYEERLRSIKRNRGLDLEITDRKK